MRGVSLQEIAKILKVPGGDDVRVLGYQIDSRLIQKGDLFFCLSGARVDGHAFLAEAALKGAVGAVLSAEIKTPFPTILVPDGLIALQDLARELFARRPIPVVGITGSVGKTTVKEFVATLLSGTFRVAKSPLSHNSQRTYPLAVLNRSEEDDVMVLEMGMSKPGEIAALTEIVAPDVALITKIEWAHAENFCDGIRGIARAKGEIFSRSTTQKAVVEAGVMQYPEIRNVLPKQSVVVSLDDPKADVYVSITHKKQLEVFELGARVIQCDAPVQEKHFVHNLALAMAAARVMGVSWGKIEQQLSLLSLPKMRFEQFERGGILFINDAYNANPASMKAALESVPEARSGGKKIAVLGAMKELGVYSSKAHEEIGRFAQPHLDMLFCLGTETIPLCEAFKESRKPVEHFLDRDALVKRLQEVLRSGDVVLFKGSRSVQIESILEKVVAYVVAAL